MVEACLLPLRTMHVAPFSGTQWVYVAIKRISSLCSQTPLKCCVSEPLEIVRVVHDGEQGTNFFKRGYIVLTAKAESENLLREPHLYFLPANRQETRISFQVLSGFMCI